VTERSLRPLSVLAAALLAAAAPPLWAGRPQSSPGLPTLEQVLDKYVQAIGGRAAFEKLTSCVMKGSVEAPATGDTGSLVPGTIEVDQKAPDKWASHISFPGGGADDRGYDGKTAWYTDPDEGPKDLNAEESASVRLLADFYRPIHLQELFPKMAVKGKVQISSQECYFVEAPHPGGSLEKLYFDARTGLLVRDEVPVNVPDEGRTTIVNDFDDFRQVDGVKLPFTVRQTSPDFDYVIHYTDVRHNVSIDDAKFKKPSG
jgi:zinc protease